ncbi:hypothetical protein GCM10010485_19980 [Streptosporangium carneum]
MHLQGAVLEDDDRAHDVVAGQVELHLEAGIDRQAQASEIDPLPLGVRLAGVPRPRLPDLSLLLQRPVPLDLLGLSPGLLATATSEHFSHAP